MNKVIKNKTMNIKVVKMKAKNKVNKFKSNIKDKIKTKMEDKAKIKEINKMKSKKQNKNFMRMNKFQLIEHHFFILNYLLCFFI
jgi:hypothetical protein